jgi:hypothetical protein
MWGALSLTRGRVCRLQLLLALAIAVATCIRVRVPWDSRLYFTVADSRFPFSSPPTIRKAWTELKSKSKSHCDWRLVSQSVSQSVSLRVEPRLGLMTRYLLLFDSSCSLWGALSDERTGLSFVHATGPCQRRFSAFRPSSKCSIKVNWTAGVILVI